MVENKEVKMWNKRGDNKMSTEIKGYMAAPVTQQKCPTTARKNYKVKQKLLGAILIVLGAATIPMENDITVFIMCLFFGIAAIFGGNDNE